MYKANLEGCFCSYSTEIFFIRTSRFLKNLFVHEYIYGFHDTVVADMKRKKNIHNALFAISKFVSEFCIRYSLFFFI